MVWGPAAPYPTSPCVLLQPATTLTGLCEGLDFQQVGHLQIREDQGVGCTPHPQLLALPPTPTTAASASFLWNLMGLVQTHLSLCSEPLTLGLGFC